MLCINKFAVEYLTKGCVTDQNNPCFTFSLTSDQKHIRMKQATIMFNSWEKTILSQEPVVYDGEDLKPFSNYTVKLFVEDNTGEKAQCELDFETGRMGKPWKAVWITDGAYRFTERRTSPETMTFRRLFSTDKKIRTAKLYSTALGIYELQINGAKVGSDYFAPGFTSYRNQLQYQIYDITEQLQKSNELIAVVGGGWAVGAFTHKRRNRVFAKRQAFLCEIRITYIDGTEELIGTGEDWQVTREGNFRKTEFYDGEHYRADIDQEDIVWRTAKTEIVRLHPLLLADYGAPVRVQEIKQPVSSFRAKSGMIIYDFGQNFAGVICAKLNGSRGQKITFLHAEILMDGELYTVPLRTAKQEAVYYCKDGEQTYSPRMTYMGFRYVGVMGIDEEQLDLSAYVLYSDIEVTGNFQCSNELLNQLQSNIMWSAKSNFIDIPTDCPQRDERMGWTGDIALFAATALNNFNLSRFLRKWLKDVKSEQTFGGGIPMIVPLVRVPSQWEIMIPMAVDHWGDACILVPWAEYMAKGDLNLLREYYPTMKRYIKACTFWAGLFSFGKHKRIWKLLHHYGDWCAPGVKLMGWMGRGKWTATACLANSSAILAKIAKLLDQKDDAEYYDCLSHETAQAYREILMDSDCRVKKEFQTAYVLPLYYQMLSEADNKQASEHLARMIRENGYHIGTGFPGTPYVLFALADNGYQKEAFNMLLTDTCPSWLYEVKVGGTTIWERWDALREDGSCNTGENDGTGGMVSFNHYAGGAVGDFLYRRLAGIEAVEGGYKTFRIRPVMGGDINWVKAGVQTAYGTITSDWKLTDSQFTIQVEIPVGTICHLDMPDGSSRTLDSGAYTFSCCYLEK